MMGGKDATVDKRTERGEEEFLLEAGDGEKFRFFWMKIVDRLNPRSVSHMSTAGQLLKQ